MSARFFPGRMDFDAAVSEHYHAARFLSPDAVEDWRAALARHIPDRPHLRVLDLGSGTGRFSPLLAEWFRAQVIGIEPSPSMREVARSSQPHRRVVYVGGHAEEIPLKDGCCEVAWLGNVIHHIPDRMRAGGELRRVLRPGAQLLIAGAFPGRLEGITLFRYFRAAKQVAEEFPALEECVALLEAAGFLFQDLDRVTQRTCESLRELAERTRLRADTTLKLISDEEFVRGQAALERSAAEEVEPRPVLDTLDLLVFHAG